MLMVVMTVVTQLVFHKMEKNINKLLPAVIASTCFRQIGMHCQATAWQVSILRNSDRLHEHLSKLPTVKVLHSKLGKES